MALNSITRQELIKKIALAKELDKRKAKNNLVEFMKYDSKGEWIPAEHLKILCNKLEKVEQGLIKRLMVFMPPRHGKSEVVSKKFPAWYLGRNPEKEIIESSYTADIAYDFSRIARNTLKDNSDVFNQNIADDSSAVKRWGLKGHRGGLTAAGVGGPITGRGAHVAIIDDPVKNWEEAISETHREKVWDWYRSTLRTRLAPGGAIILVMTRWHEDDLAGRLLNGMDEDDDINEEWDVVNFPAIAEENDILGRNPGQALWPQRYPLSEIESFRKDLGSKIFDSLYQQKPRKDKDGALWKDEYIKHVGKHPELERIVVAVDPAVTSNKKSDETGIVAVGRGTDGFAYVLDDSSLIASPNGWASKTVSAYNRHTADRIIGEANNGGDLVETNIRTVDKDIPYEKVWASRGKQIRAEPVAALYEQGKVFHVGHFYKLEKEMLTWVPGNKSPNRMDALVWALTYLMLGDSKKASIRMLGN